MDDPTSGSDLSRAILFSAAAAAASDGKLDVARELGEKATRRIPPWSQTEDDLLIGMVESGAVESGAFGDLRSDTAWAIGGPVPGKVE